MDSTDSNNICIPTGGSGFTFYRSYFDAGEILAPKDRGMFYAAIVTAFFRSFDDVDELPMSKAARACFALVKPFISKSVKRSKARIKSKSDEKQPPIKTKSKAKQEEGKGKEKGTYYCESGAPTLEKLVSFAETHYSPVPPMAFLEEFHQRMTESGWLDKRGGDLTVRGRWQRELSAWWAQAKKNSPPRAAVPVGGSQRGVGDVPAGFEGAPVGTELPCPCPQFGERGDE